MQTTPEFPASIAREVFATLCASLPPPITDTPEGRAARDEVAMAAVAALHPTDALEAKLAADIVLAEAYYADTLRLAGEFRNDLAATDRYRARATSMLRQMRGLLRDYERRQAERDKALAAMHPAAMERAGWWFREASVPAPAPQPAKAPEPAEPAAVGPAPPLDFAALNPAEQYAVMYPDRARGIRAAGGLPAGYNYGPPDPEILDGLVNGTSPILRQLDRMPPGGVMI